MKLLVVGDIVGKPGLDKLNERLLTTIREQNIDFCIVNGENSANGKGLRLQEYNAILNYGADAITMGNHIYYRKEMAEEYIKLDKLVLPANITNLNGNKYVIVEKNGIKLAVIQLLGGVEMGKIFEDNSISPFKSVIEQIEIVKDSVDYIVVDFHAEATAEKIAMGYYLEDKVNLVFGTHTHIQTADETIFDTGMAYITDIGMTGPKGSVIGLKKEIALSRFVENKYLKYECSTNEACFCGIIVEFDDITKKAKSIIRINE